MAPTSKIVPTLRRRLPAPARRIGGTLLDWADPIAVRRARRRGQISGPIPPRHLRARVGEAGVAAYQASGRRVAAEIEEVLAGVGKPIGGARAIWDFGGGSGRVLTKLRAPAAKLASSDVDPEACRWLAANHDVDARKSEASPPTPFSDDAFDLVIAVSVFTHLNERDQDRWLGEVDRVLAPGGVALLTTMGPRLLESYRAGRRPGMEAAAERLPKGDLSDLGIAFAMEPSTTWTARRRPGTAESYGLTFHGRDYVREHWGRHLTVVTIAEEAINWGQDAVVCTSSARPG